MVFYISLALKLMCVAHLPRALLLISVSLNENAAQNKENVVFK